MRRPEALTMGGLAVATCRRDVAVGEVAWMRLVVSHLGLTEYGSRAPARELSPDSAHGRLRSRRVPGAAAVLRHLAASLGAATAGLCALPHHVVVGREFAVLGAAVANFGADRADAAM